MARCHAVGVLVERYTRDAAHRGWMVVWNDPWAGVDLLEEYADDVPETIEAEVEKILHDKNYKSALHDHEFALRDEPDAAEALVLECVRHGISLQSLMQASQVQYDNQAVFLSRGPRDLHRHDLCADEVLVVEAKLFPKSRVNTLLQV